MGFLDTGNKKHQGQHRQEHLRLLSNDGDCVTFHRLTAYHLFLGSHFDGTLASRRALRNTSNVWRDIELNLSEICHHHQQHEIFSGICRFIIRKVRVSRFTQKPVGLKNVFESPPWTWSKKYFLEISWKKYPIYAVKKWMIMEGLWNSCLTWGFSQFPVT